MMATNYVKVFAYLFVTALVLHEVSANPKPKLLIVSLDGFRYDYMDLYETPNLKQLASEGVIASEGMIPSFPSVTFPNHYTLMTGLYPESHGIIYNKMYDPVYDEYFAYSNDSKWWNDTEPIWITATENGLKTGVSFWPGSTITIRGKTADYSAQWYKNVDFTSRLNVLIDWFVSKNIDFGAIYFEQPDGQGHKFGPNSQEVKEMVKEMDALIGNLIEHLKKNNLYDNINIIVTSDHGMSKVTKDRSTALILADHLKAEDYKNITQSGAIGGIMPEPNKEESIFNSLNKRHPNITIYHKKDIPDRFHFQKHRRIMPIIAIADEGFIVSKDVNEWESSSIGIHGYDNQLVNMRAIFVARGPSFKKGETLKPFENVNVYPLMCQLLEIPPHPCNGTSTVFESVLTSIAIGRSLSFCSLVMCLIASFVWKESLFGR